MPLMECTKNGIKGYKWGENGVCIVGPGAKEKALSIGRAIKASDKGLICDKLGTFKTTLDKTTGFLTSSVNLARTGVQYYYGYELGLSDRAYEKIGVYRSPEEVFSEDSIRTFINLTATDDHPTVDVNTDNIKELQIGTVSEVKRNGDVLKGIVTITDKEVINKIQNGKTEVSVGYSQTLVKKDGIYNGDKYEFVQTNIRANHLAVVDKGRCGQLCKINLNDGKEKSMYVIIVDGMEFEVEDKHLAQAYKRQQAKDAEEKEQMKEKTDEEMEKLKKEKEEMKKEKDSMEAQRDAALKSKMSDEDLNSLIDKRAQILNDGKRILKDEFPECNNCDKEIKAAVIDKVFPDTDLKNQSDSYIDAYYDLAVKHYDKAGESIKKLGDDLKSKDGKKITRDSARKEYMKKIGMEV